MVRLQRDGIVVIAPKRIAVLGLYNSGSTVLAGMLHHMGVNMGAPFWMTSEDDHPENFYESWELSCQVRHWWREPTAEERVGGEDRIRFLQSWAMVQEAERPGPLGAKHPLLSLSAPDLATAWGPATLFIRAARPLEESIEGLCRRGWFPGHEVTLQTRLWNTLEAFEQSHGSVACVDWNRVKADPAWAARELSAAAGLSATEQQLQAAAALVRMSTLQALAA